MMIRYVESEVSKCYHFCRATVMSVKVQVGSPVGHESYGTNNMGNRVSDKPNILKSDTMNGCESDIGIYREGRNREIW